MKCGALQDPPGPPSCSRGDTAFKAESEASKYRRYVPRLQIYLYNAGQHLLSPKVDSTEIMMVRLVPGLPAPLRHPGFSIPWQDWRQFGETWLGNVWPLGSPDCAILSPAGKTMTAQKHEKTNLLTGGKICPKVARVAHQFKTRS